MKSLIAAAVLFTVTQVFAQQPPTQPCMTNVTVVCTNDSRVLVNGSTNYGIAGTYTNVSGMDLVSGGGIYGCDNSGTVLTFTTVGCNPSAVAVANIKYDCRGYGCPNEGGDGCGTGGNLTITMPPQCGYLAVRIFSRYGCCTLDYCILYQNHCDLPPEP